MHLNTIFSEQFINITQLKLAKNQKKVKIVIIIIS